MLARFGLRGLSAPAAWRAPRGAACYHDNVIDHYENPRNVGSLDKNVPPAGGRAELSQDKSVGTGLVGAPACGDVMKLQIKVNDETGEIEKAVFKASPPA